MTHPALKYHATAWIKIVPQAQWEMLPLIGGSESEVPLRKNHRQNICGLKPSDRIPKANLVAFGESCCQWQPRLCWLLDCVDVYWTRRDRSSCYYWKGNPRGQRAAATSAYRCFVQAPSAYTHHIQENCADSTHAKLNIYPRHRLDRLSVNDYKTAQRRVL